ncbi:hypothetical protein FJ930_05780 [Mesorhizobium sp. B2-4-15]|nr:hypothetical protein FJ930_05780 [Mesorhizobium sp. B2-4-15]
MASLGKFDRASGGAMFKLTRRTLLVGTSALMAAGTVSFRALAAPRTMTDPLTSNMIRPKAHWPGLCHQQGRRERSAGFC